MPNLTQASQQLYRRPPDERNRDNVRRSTPKYMASCFVLLADGPCCIAATSMTITLTYTFLPRKRTDGGAARFLQPSRSQQKLNRSFRSDGGVLPRPRGDLG